MQESQIAPRASLAELMRAAREKLLSERCRFSNILWPDLSKDTMQLLLSSLNNTFAALPPQRRPTDHEQRKAFRDELEALLDRYFLKLPPTLASSGFGSLSEKVKRRSLKGGRPRHVSMDTLVLALADLYARTTSNRIETLPISESSRFVNFMDGCLSPLYCDADLASALGRRWKDLRKAIRAVPTIAADPLISDAPQSDIGQMASCYPDPDQSCIPTPPQEIAQVGA